MNEIQQHDGVVVEVAGIPAGLRQAQAGGRGRRQGLGCGFPPSPPLYRPPGGRRPWDPIYMGGGRRPRGETCPPSQVGRPPPLGFPTLGAGGGPRGEPQPTKGWFPSHFSPWGPLGWVAPAGGPPGPFRWSRYNTGNPQNFPGGRNLTSYI